MTRTRHQNEHLTSSEAALLKAWAWEKHIVIRTAPPINSSEHTGLNWDNPWHSCTRQTLSSPTRKCSATASCPPTGPGESNL